jgi:peroxisomal membrane protein 2
VANHLAGVPLRSGKASPVYTRALSAAKIDLRAFKLAIYGFLVGAPLSHVLVSALQKAFEGKETPLYKILFLIANNILVAPVQTAGQHLSPLNTLSSCLQHE